MGNDFLFTPGSTTAWEACSIGIPMIVGFIADNQMGIADILGKEQAVLNMGWYNKIPVSVIKEKFLTLLNDRTILNQFVTSQKMIIDGKSKTRYRKLFAEL